jgi:peptide/nickel transport system ATP-binding protein/oligopeptide transport system ATP-binding protein
MAEAAVASALLSVEGISKSFAVGRHRFFGGGGESFRALDDVSLSIEPGETVALVGESGSGKSTLARVIVGLIEPDAGRVSLRVDGADGGSQGPDGFRPRAQLVFQDPYSSLNPRRSIGSAIAEPANAHHRIPPGQSVEDYVGGLLRQVGLSPRLAGRYPRELSGGQRQRVAIARALSVRPEILIADEAVSALDVSVQAQILNLFEELREELGLTMLFISHQLPVVSHVADRIIVLYRGRIVETGTPASIFDRPAHPYTAALIGAQPGRHRRGGAATARSRREIPASQLMARGCSFRDRCPLAAEVCAEVRPELERLGDGIEVACHRHAEVGKAP